MVDMKSGFVGSGKAKLYYETAGEGQPLVFIHAGVADHRQWNNEFPFFAQDYQVLRYDLRGYGRSKPVDGYFSHMQDLIALLDHHQIDESVVLIGCSMGGSLAMDFVLEHPSRVRGLVMVGSGPSGLALEVPEHPKQSAAEEAYEAGDLDQVAELETQIWFDGMGRNPDQVNQEMRGLALEMNRIALAHDARQLGKRLPDTDTPATKRLTKLDVPVLVVVGEHDVPYIQAAGDYMVDNIPSVRRFHIKNQHTYRIWNSPINFRRSFDRFWMKYCNFTSNNL
jgi:pimeloyl-ACP methyl ester carboxylesterase